MTARITVTPADRYIQITTSAICFPRLDGGHLKIDLEPGEMKRVTVNGKPVVIERLRPM